MWTQGPTLNGGGSLLKPGMEPPPHPQFSPAQQTCLLRQMPQAHGAVVRTTDHTGFRYNGTVYSRAFTYQ